MYKARILFLSLVGLMTVFEMSNVLAAKTSISSGKAAGDVKEPLNKPPRIVMLKLNDEEITVEDYVNFLQHNPIYMQSSVSSEEGKKAAVQALVANRLLREDMVRKGLLPKSKKSTEAEFRDAFAKLAEQKFPMPPPPDDDTAFKFYQTHQNEYGIPEMVRISQIQFRVPENATPEQKRTAKERAEAALRRVNAGEAFAKIAGELTENPLGKSPQGDLGFLSRLGDPWLTKAIQNLKVGEHTQVVESPAGYEILMVTDIRPALISPYPNVREKVIQRIRAEEQAKQRQIYVKELAKGVKIQLIQEELKALFPNGLFP